MSASCGRKLPNDPNTRISDRIARLIDSARSAAGDGIVNPYRKSKVGELPYSLTHIMTNAMLRRDETDGFIDLTSKAADFGTANSAATVTIICGTKDSKGQPRIALAKVDNKDVLVDKSWIVTDGSGKKHYLVIRDSGWPPCEASPSGKPPYHAALPTVDTYRGPHPSSSLFTPTTDFKLFIECQSRKADRLRGLTDIDRVDFVAKGIILQFQTDTQNPHTLLTYWGQGIVPREDPRPQHVTSDETLALWHKEVMARIKGLTGQ
ncbi:MAG: hypothetical protein Q9227_005407 [Pyrenula ochraceoflavens]